MTIDMKGRDWPGALVLASIVAVITGIALGMLSGCGLSKHNVNDARDAIREACEILAAEQAEKAGLNVQDVIDATCAVENVTRGMLDAILREQRAAAQKAGLELEEK